MVTIESTAEMAAKVYETMERNLAIVRRRLGRPLTLADKVLLGHADDPEHQEMEAGKSYSVPPSRPRRAAGRARADRDAPVHADAAAAVAVPTTIHCDHLIQARVEGQADLRESLAENQEVYDFLQLGGRASTARDSGDRAPASSTRSCSSSTRFRAS